MTTEAATSFEDAWRRFQEMASVQAGLGVDDEWAQGRAQLLAFLVRVFDPQMRAAIPTVIESLSGLPCLDFYPEDYWHITVKMVGFQVERRTRDDEVLRRDVGPILQTAENALVGQAPFDVEIGPVNAFRDVVFLEVHDRGRLNALHKKLVRALSRYARSPQDGDAYLPHLTVARYVSQEGLTELKERLATLRPRKLGTLPVRQVELVKAWLTGGYPEFDVLGRVMLGRPA